MEILLDLGRAAVLFSLAYLLVMVGGLTAAAKKQEEDKGGTSL